MIGLILSFLGRMFMGILLFSLILLFMSLAASLRLLPRLVRGIRQLMRGFLILSYRFYRLTFTRLQPLILERLGVDIMSGYARLIMCISFSMIQGILSFMVFDPSTAIWILGFSLVHGLFVGLAWDDIENPGGIRLGVNRQ